MRMKDQLVMFGAFVTYVDEHRGRGEPRETLTSSVVIVADFFVAKHANHR